MIDTGCALESLAMRSSEAATGTRTTTQACSISTTTGPTTTTTTSASADPTLQRLDAGLTATEGSILVESIPQVTAKARQQAKPKTAAVPMGAVVGCGRLLGINMKSTPILFNGDMVRAILNGSKTQTRRLVKPSIVPHIEYMGGSNDDCTEFEFVGLKYGTWTDGKNKAMPPEWLIYCDEYPEEGVIPIGQVYGAIGDQLWVKETWGVVSHSIDGNGEHVNWVPDRPNTRVFEMPFGRGYYTGHAIYRADGEFEWAGEDGDEEGRSMWKPSIHMPRWASRITLQIINVRVERLNDISEADALAEGCQTDYAEGDTLYWFDGLGVNKESGRLFAYSAKEAYSWLWESINGAGSWAANPWVWVVEFKVIKP